MLSLGVGVSSLISLNLFGIVYPGVSSNYFFGKGDTTY
jgi:hypothetical protein